MVGLSGLVGLGLSHYSGASDVPEWYGVGHLQGHSSGKGTDLFMNVHEEGVGLPAAHLLDGAGINVIEVHCHGSTSA